MRRIKRKFIILSQHQALFDWQMVSERSSSVDTAYRAKDIIKMIVAGMPPHHPVHTKDKYWSEPVRLSHDWVEVILFGIKDGIRCHL